MTRGCLNIALSERIPKTYCRNDVSDGDSCPPRSDTARRPFQCASAEYFSESRVQYVERLARVQAAYCQLFSARGENRKIDRTIYRGDERERRARQGPASERAGEQETTDRIDTINRGHRRDPSSTTKASSRDFSG